MISIAMATYNGDAFIELQIKSILDQTYSNIELIIVDDISTDNTCEIIKKYLNLDSRIKFFQNKTRLGCAKNFERAISLCQGDYIALCDQDDIWLPNKLDVLFSNMKDNILIYSGCNVIDEIGAEINDSFMEINHLNGLDSTVDDFTIYALFNSFVLGCSILFEKKLIRAILPIRYDLYNHDKWIVFVASIEGKVKYIDDKLFSYRVHSNNYSISTQSKSSILKDVEKVITRTYKRSDAFYSPEFYNDHHFTKELPRCLVSYNNYLGGFNNMNMAKKLCRLFSYRKYLFATDFRFEIRFKKLIKFILKMIL